VEEEVPNEGEEEEVEKHEQEQIVDLQEGPQYTLEDEAESASILEQEEGAKDSGQPPAVVSVEDEGKPDDDLEEGQDNEC
jgi:hypothetical protein